MSAIKMLVKCWLQGKRNERRVYMSQETTIPDYIENYRDIESSFDTIHFKSKNTVDVYGKTGDTLILLDDSVLEKYRADLEDLIVTKKMTSKEQFRYYCNPWVLSFDLYGTVEYWGLLLDLNNMSSVVEFTRPNIKVYDASLPDVIDAILALEEDAINLNKESLEEESYEPNDYEMGDDVDEEDFSDDEPEENDEDEDDE